MLIVNSPHNPTGVVLSRDTLVRLIELATEFDMLVLADHAYEAFHHPTVERISLRAVADTERARVITTGSFSKSHSMTGFRVGYVHATREIIDRCATLHAHLTDNVCTFAQYGAVAATELPPTYLSSRASLIQDRLEAAHALISKVLPCPRPHGGFYVFPDLTPVLGGRWKDGTDFAIDLLKEAGVSILAGGTFGSGRHIRISIAGTERDLVESATRRIVAFIESRY
jgi:aspartate aminotransferase